VTGISSAKSHLIDVQLSPAHHGFIYEHLVPCALRSSSVNKVILTFIQSEDANVGLTAM
jgi:hypothetical protein